ncbi:MAG: type II toxin-antitoxin system PemK/MazF family toxin [Gemmatimonadota bacterium]|jgi:mRNA-degrading endonuclease toxin of MazEF toxin-antitoxin module|nr:type II toxin-antitoxin system PemK/MazF family toxin [Gemmatimonadota bacterium]
MKRGEVWWVDFAPSVGGEIRKQRLLRRAGELSRDDIEAVERAVRVQLGLVT